MSYPRFVEVILLTSKKRIGWNVIYHFKYFCKSVDRMLDTVYPDFRAVGIGSYPADISFRIGIKYAVRFRILETSQIVHTK